MAISPIAAYKAAAPSQLNNVMAPGAEQSSGKSFGDFLKGGLNDTLSSVQNFEQAGTKALTGQVTDLDLIAHTNNAELNLQAFKVIWEKSLTELKSIIEKTAL